MQCSPLHFTVVLGHHWKPHVREMMGYPSMDSLAQQELELCSKGKSCLPKYAPFCTKQIMTVTQ